MSNCEKKLDALIDALGFDCDVEFNQQKYNSEMYMRGAGPDYELTVRRSCQEVKLTKRNPKQTTKELITDLAQELYKHSIVAGVAMHTLNYNGTTLKYSHESGLMEIVTDEKI